jgi:hypothetical protein
MRPWSLSTTDQEEHRQERASILDRNVKSPRMKTQCTQPGADALAFMWGSMRVSPVVRCLLREQNQSREYFARLGKVIRKFSASCYEGGTADVQVETVYSMPRKDCQLTNSFL